jgi:hypothetical protein
MTTVRQCSDMSRAANHFTKCCPIQVYHHRSVLQHPSVWRQDGDGQLARFASCMLHLIKQVDGAISLWNQLLNPAWLPCRRIADAATNSGQRGQNLRVVFNRCSRRKRQAGWLAPSQGSFGRDCQLPHHDFTMISRYIHCHAKAPWHRQDYIDLSLTGSCESTSGRPRRPEVLTVGGELMAADAAQVSQTGLRSGQSRRQKKRWKKTQRNDPMALAS